MLKKIIIGFVILASLTVPSVAVTSDGANTTEYRANTINQPKNDAISEENSVNKEIINDDKKDVKNENTDFDIDEEFVPIEHHYYFKEYGDVVYYLDADGDLTWGVSSRNLDCDCAPHEYCDNCKDKYKDDEYNRLFKEMGLIPDELVWIENEDEDDSNDSYNLDSDEIPDNEDNAEVEEE